MAVVTFNVDTFREIYPEFSNVSDTVLSFLFTEATILLNNTDSSKVTDVTVREPLLYMLMAHIAYIRFGTSSGSGGSGLVGRVSSATEGSVSVSTDLGSLSESATWYAQSPYGLTYWQLTAGWRNGSAYYPGSKSRGYYGRQDY